MYICMHAQVELAGNSSIFKQKSLLYSFVVVTVALTIFFTTKQDYQTTTRQASENRLSCCSCAVVVSFFIMPLPPPITILRVGKSLKLELREDKVELSLFTAPV